MLRKIIRIDEEKCNGCGACAKACHEGAIEMIDGVAKLLSVKLRCRIRFPGENQCFPSGLVRLNLCL